MESTLHKAYYIFLLLSFVLHAQSQNTNWTLTGKLVDEVTNEPIIGATVVYEAGKGAVTDTSGIFNISLPNGTYNLKINFVGYKPVSRKVTVSGANVNINAITLLNVNNLNEIEIAADVAKIQETPIAASNITSKQIFEELGANDLPSLLNTTPGAYSSQQGGGFGDSRVNIRGFSQNNIAVLVDGIPVNDMENGSVYWSNWAGLSEVTSKMQVQRGLGASRLALPSIGGVMNIITMPVEHKRSFIVKNDLGTNNYRRTSLSYNSGLIKNKIGFTLSGSYTGGDGYIDNTWVKAWSYFAKISYKINSRSMLMFGFNGAPQSHGQRSYAINVAYHDQKFAQKLGINTDSLYAAPTDPYSNKYIGARGITYSPDWGYVNGEKKSVKVNYFHKPLFNLSYFLNINPRLYFTNVLYLSLGNGGGTTLNSFPAYDKGTPGTPGSGQLLLQDDYNVNVFVPASTLTPGQSPSTYYMYSSINQHKWVGTLSSLKWKINNHFDYLGGFDARYYQGTHYQTPYDYLGGNYVIMSPGRDANLKPNTVDPMAYVKYIGDKMNYYYQSKVTWLGLFSQMEYKSEKVTAFVTLTGNQTSLQSVNYFGKRDFVVDKKNVIHNAMGYGDTLYTDGEHYGVRTNPYDFANVNPITHNGDGSITFLDNLTHKNVTIGKDYSVYDFTSSKTRVNTTDLKVYYGYTAKGGANYKITENHNVYVNGGYMNVAPRFSNVFDKSGTELKNIKSQLITSAEIGYGYKDYNFSANVGAYYTDWKNKPLDFATSLVDPTNPQNIIYYNVPGVDAKLKGMEFSAAAGITSFLKADIFGMFADWRWASGGNVYVFSQDGTLADSVKFDATNVHIANSPQQQIGGSLRFEYKGFYIKPQYVHFDKMYAQFDPTALKIVGSGSAEKDYRRTESWKMPGFGLYNLFLGYSCFTTRNTKIDIVASMNNVLNTVYMTDAFFSSTVTPDKYNALNSIGWMGLGRRINIGIKLTF
jgi:hypothetical protein